MASKVGICNMAIGFLGDSDEIANLDTERSSAARACRLFYPEVLKELLRDFDWKFAKRVVALGLVEENPNDEWGYSYRYPSDCVRAIRILSGLRNDTIKTRIAYDISSDDGGELIYTDAANAELAYTKFLDDPSKYPPDFTMALAYLLASRIAPKLVSTEPLSAVEDMLKLYEKQVGKAKSAMAMEVVDDPEADPEIIKEYT